MNELQNLLDQSSLPAITAFILGLLTALSVGHQHRHHRIYRQEHRKPEENIPKRLLYTLGCIVSYTLLGFLLIPLIQEGSSMFDIQNTVARLRE